MQWGLSLLKDLKLVAKRLPQNNKLRVFCIWMIQQTYNKISN